MAKDILTKLEENQKKLAEVIPDTMKHFRNVHDSALEEGRLTKREKVFVGLGIAIAKQCSYCIVKYLKLAIEMKISLEEIIEVCGVGILMNGGPGVAYSTFVIETYNQLLDE